jgi:hypothetical protein
MHTTSKAILTMCNLLLNSLAVHHSRTFRNLKKEHPDQADLLVGKHNIGEPVMAQKQATGTHQKILSILLSICSPLLRQASFDGWEPAARKGCHYISQVK